MRTETLAIVFTDIKGYTAATSSQTHQENAAMLRRTEKLIEPVVRAFDGRVVKNIGDAFMIVFTSPTAAVKCAAAVQDHIYTANAGGQTTPVHIRIAINVGEVRVHRGDVFGEPVNIAARIESVTPADDIYLSKATYLTMNRSDLPCELVGDFELKGLPEPVTVYRLKKFAQRSLADDPNLPMLALDSPAAAAAAATAATILPYGGNQLQHWVRMQWIQSAYLSMWVLGLSGIASAAYLRYRPAADYSHLVQATKHALELNHPADALATAGQIPLDAVEERSHARRYRRDAVLQQIGAGSLDQADQELRLLIKEEPRDAEALLLRGILLDRRGNDSRGMLESFQQALKLQPSLADNNDITNAVVQAYRQAPLRLAADRMVELYLKQRAIPALQRTIADPNLDRLARRNVAMRLEKLGAGDSVDWVNLALDDLHSTACNTRKAAINKLMSEGDERAVGPLMKLAEARSCGAKEAKAAAMQILGN